MFIQKILVVVLIVAVVVLAGVLVWQNWIKPAPVVNNQPPASDETANWKTYTNGQYGFEFKYPKEFELTTYYANHTEEKQCDFISELSLQSNDLPKIQWEANGEKVAPTISVRVENADCPSILNMDWTLPQEVNKVIDELKNRGVSIDKLYYTMFNGISWYPTEATPHFDCKNVSVVQMGGNFAVENSECSDGPVYPYTAVYVIPTGNILVEFRDNASKYQYNDIFNKIVSTFKFTK